MEHCLFCFVHLKWSKSSLACTQMLGWAKDNFTVLQWEGLCVCVFFSAYTLGLACEHGAWAMIHVRSKAEWEGYVFCNKQESCRLCSKLARWPQKRKGETDRGKRKITPPTVCWWCLGTVGGVVEYIWTPLGWHGMAYGTEAATDTQMAIAGQGPQQEGCRKERCLWVWLWPVLQNVFCTICSGRPDG